MRHQNYITIQKVGNLNAKMTQNRLEKRTFPFFLKKLLPLKKNEKRYFIFYYKNRNTCQFHAFTIKNYFGNVPESDKFRFENSLKKVHKVFDPN